MRSHADGRHARRLLWLAIPCLTLSACSSGAGILTPDEYRQRLPALEAAADARPSDAAAQRDLGEALAQTGAFERAHTVLLRAEAQVPDDPRVQYYLGVAEEGRGNRPAALGRYARFEDVPQTSPYRRLLAGRHAWLLRETIRDEIAALLVAEDSLTADGVTEAVAVFPLTFRGGDSLYRPLGRGLSEMLTTDLASVDRIRVVERVRLQTLLDELYMSQGAAFDAATAPRLGRLLRSGRVVGGSFAVQGEALRTDVALWSWSTEPLPDLTTHEATIDEFFRLEKEIVFNVLADLGVELTAAERERIERVPTRNFQAFRAYSRGLLEQDAGQDGAAAAAFAEAARLDAGFSEAANRAEAASDLAGVAGGVDVALTAGTAAARPTAPKSLVYDRLRILTATVGATVEIDDEARNPTAEVPAPSEGYSAPPPPPGGND